MWLGCVFFIIVGIVLLALIANDYFSCRDKRAVEVEIHRLDREKSVEIAKLQSEVDTLRSIIETFNIQK